MTEQEKDEEISRLRQKVAQMEAWQARGEELIDAHYNGVLFSMGSWWADRPWRRRPDLVAYGWIPPKAN